ncbi:MAG TPA: hypothetical protein VKB54_19820 [Solirubrobacteraceae bacterium]|nr:hypothetical protein [Solirubrobacteraceae bacterium]
MALARALVDADVREWAAAPTAAEQQTADLAALIERDHAVEQPRCSAVVSNQTAVDILDEDRVRIRLDDLQREVSIGECRLAGGMRARSIYRDSSFRRNRPRRSSTAHWPKVAHCNPTGI